MAIVLPPPIPWPYDRNPCYPNDFYPRRLSFELILNSFNSLMVVISATIAGQYKISCTVSTTLNATPMTLPQILIVDDNSNNLQVLSIILKNCGYQVRKAVNGAMALASAQLDPPDLILLDVCMPQMDGYEVCRRLKLDPNTSDIPIIFISALGDVENKLQGLEVGGIDYISKPFYAEEVLARVKNHLQLRASALDLKQNNLQLQRKIEEKSQEISKVSEYLEQKILENTQFYEEYQRLATHDPSTGTLNRLGFLQKIKHMVEQGIEFALVLMQYDYLSIIEDIGYQSPPPEQLINVDNLNQSDTCINEDDLLDYTGGQPILPQIVEYLIEYLPLVDDQAISYLGCGEFGLLLNCYAHESDAIIETLTDFSRKIIHINSSDLLLKWYIGIAFSNSTYRWKSEQLLWDAELAISLQKDRGIAKINIFEPTIKNELSIRLQLEKSLQFAIDRNELSVVYQPIVSLTPQKLVGLEALVRWTHPELGVVSPSQFIPIAEKSGLIVQLDRWVFKKVCQDFHILNQSYRQSHALEDQDLVINVNFSTQQFEDANVLEYMDEVMQLNQVSGHHLKIEIIESNLLEQSNSFYEIIRGFKERGIKLALDDFGTGYSTFSYLQSIPFDSLKIDQSFIQRIESDRNIVKAIIQLCRSCSLKVVAEGIEDQQQLQDLMGLDCDLGQGYLFSHPLTVQEFQQNFGSIPILPRVSHPLTPSPVLGEGE